MCCGRLELAAGELMPEEAVGLGMRCPQGRVCVAGSGGGADNPELFAEHPHMMVSLEPAPNSRHQCKEVSCQLSDCGDSETRSIGCCHLVTVTKGSLFPALPGVCFGLTPWVMCVVPGLAPQGFTSCVTSLVPGQGSQGLLLLSSRIRLLI